MPHPGDARNTGTCCWNLRNIQRQQNIALRRVRFEERRQQNGELFDDFFVSLKELADDAELCSACVDDRLVTRIISGVADQNLRRKLLAIDPPPSLAEALRVCRSEESAVHTETELAGTRRTIGRAASKTQVSECFTPSLGRGQREVRGMWK